ncbi:hypothetical protein RHGRI_038609 [Rhododendron griersonianum]|uniref:Uncharacterized protein n=1 Tax=Rhododendron griersonianum TaxID=479676 RepID=A0AAV6HIR6_9ERIC|nr:hypothetical protein RHGRI_038609 [Rhododendron griersonianum]
METFDRIKIFEEQKQIAVTVKIGEHIKVVLKIGEQIKFESETRQRHSATMKQLSQIFPEFIPKLFFLAATEVRENEDKFGVPDSKTGTIVGGDLVIFLRTGRDALP